MRFPLEEKKGIILFEFSGVVKDYNDIEIKQTSHYIDMSCESYINCLWKPHDWEATISTLDINVEVNCVEIQFPNPNPSSINPEIDKNTHTKVIFPKTLYPPNQMTPMPSDCIKKIYNENF